MPRSQFLLRFPRYSVVINLAAVKPRSFEWMRVNSLTTARRNQSGGVVALIAIIISDTVDSATSPLRHRRRPTTWRPLYRLHGNGARTLLTERWPAREPTVVLMMHTGLWMVTRLTTSISWTADEIADYWLLVEVINGFSRCCLSNCDI